MTRKISDKKLETAKKYYMDYDTVSEVARKTGINRTTISHHVKKDGGWEYERNLARAELLDKVASSRKSDFAAMTSSTITVLKRALVSLADRDEPPTVQEAKGAANILEVLDKITRLDEGNPTDIVVSEKPTTIVELKKRMAVDPFAEEIEELTYEEIEETDK